MTNEKAIETLKANYPDACFEQLREAVDMAIEALKAQDVSDKKSELKPCPFCGGKAELTIIPWYFKSGLSSSGWVVRCLNGCCNQSPYMSDHDAVETWNRRVKDDLLLLRVMRKP